MKHEPVKMMLHNRSRRPFKNHLVRKSYWVNHYKCPICGRSSDAMNNVVAHKNVMCDGEKSSYVNRV